MTQLRTSQEIAEALINGTPAVRVSQEVLEPLIAGTPAVRASQIVGESLIDGLPAARASQVVAEGLIVGQRSARASQIVIEVLMANLEVPPLLTYPILAGLGYSVKWAPMHLNMPTDVTGSGAEIDLGLADTPIHDFDLTYDFLRDQFQPGTQEFRTMMGFWLASGGSRGRFLLFHPDDNQVFKQAIGTTDGTTSVWVVTRTLGVGEASGTEPVGYVDTTSPVVVYLNDVVQPAASYQILNTTPAEVQLKFNTTPTTGQAITMDIPRFLYYVKFRDNQITFEKFMDRIWQLQKVSLRSCRPGA